jgi:hypothetical protein
MSSKNSKTVGKMPKSTLSGPFAFATSGTTKIVEVEFPFPRPREQGSQDLLGSDHYLCAATETKRKKNAIKKCNDISKEYARLIHAIFNGKSGDDLTGRIEDAGGLQAMIHLKVRIKDKAYVSRPNITAFIYF